jgi:hypothetical protein
LTSYGFKETIHKTKGFEQTAACGLTDHKSDKCWKIKYPTTFPGDLTYNLIVKYSNKVTKNLVWTDTLPGTIQVECVGASCVPKVLAPVPVDKVIKTSGKPMSTLELVFTIFAAIFGTGCLTCCVCYVKMREDRELQHRFTLR